MKKIDEKIKQGVVNTLRVNRVSEPGIYPKYRDWETIGRAHV